MRAHLAPVTFHYEVIPEAVSIFLPDCDELHTLRGVNLFMELKNALVVITGASSGIGEAAAYAFAKKGARLALVSNHRPDLERVRDALREAGVTASDYLVELGKSEEVAGLIARIEGDLGAVDVLVNNAGIGLGASVLNTDESKLRLLFEVNFFALASLCKQALSGMSGRRRGVIINVSSAAGQLGSPGVSAYSATKGACHAYTQALRMEAKAYGVFVSEVLPISVKTKFFHHAEGKKYEPSGVVLTSEKVADSLVRCAASRRPRAEILPFRPVRLAFLAETALPGLLDTVLVRNYKKSLGRDEEAGSRD